MTAPRVRADYDQLTQIASQFGAQAESTRATLTKLRQQMNVLLGGDWLGKGAQAFYAEMDQSVLPRINRLAQALQAAQRVTQQISALMKHAEDDAAACFRTQGSGATARAVPGPAAEMAAPVARGMGVLGAVSSLAAGAAAVGGAGADSGSIWDKLVEGAAPGLAQAIFGTEATLLDMEGERLGYGPLATDYVRGMIDEASDMVTGLWYLATTDQNTIIKGLSYAVSHPEEVWEAFKKPYLEAIESGHPMRAWGRGVFAVGSLLLGGDLGDAGELGEVASGLGRTGRVVGEVAEETANAAGKVAEMGRIGSTGGRTGEAAEGARVASQMGEVGEGAAAAAHDFTVVDGITLNREGYKLGHVELPEAATPQMLGQAVEGPVREMIAERYGFELPSKPPSATGPDVIVPPADRARVGFDYADVKALNSKGLQEYWKQLDAWRDEGWPGGPRGTGPGNPAIRNGRAALFGYDSNGNVYLVGIWDM